MRVDEARRDDGAAEVDPLVRLGLGARADGDDHAVLDEQPAGLVLGTGVVARDDPAAGEEAPHACSGTSSKRSTSTRPRSVIFRRGMTESARNDERQERRRARPAERVRGVVARPALRDHLGERRVGEEPGDRERALGEDAAVRRRRRSRRRSRRAVSTANAMSASVMPTTMRLCASCATRRRERAALPAPSPRRSRGRSAPSRGAARRPRSSRGRGGVRDRVSPPRRRARDRPTRSRPDPGSARSRGSTPRAPGSRSRPAATGRCARVCRTQSGISTGGVSPIGRPLFSTVSGAKRHEIGEQEQVGLVPGRDRAVVVQAVPERRMEGRHARARPRARCPPRRPPAPSR